MRIRSALVAVLVLGVAVAAIPSLAQDASAKLRQLVAGSQRTPANVARDQYRHPLETLSFFGLRDDMTVVEILPGGGWWTEILAPYLKERGVYYAAVQEWETTYDASRVRKAAFLTHLAANPELYGKVRVRDFYSDRYEIAPPGSVDVILTFRNLHNWITAGTVEGALRAFHKALKPGGILGVEDHRASNDRPQDPKAENGYLREDFTIALIEKAGFKLVAKSEINANPKDTKDYKGGVWSLPPTYREGDVNRAKYQQIGESDRYTLKFMKQ
jgi:predicted methyltransferase